MTKQTPQIEDLIGLGHTKLGFFKEVQQKIGELQKSNRELDHERQHVQAILDSITDIVAVISPNYRIKSVNHSFFDVYPLDPPLTGRCFEIFRSRATPCEPCALRAAIATNQVQRHSAIIPIDGRNRHFEITASPLRSRDGEPLDILVVKRDMTLEKELQAKYYHAEKMATIGLLSAGVAHEINNPLASIHGFAEGLQRRMTALQAHIPDAALQEDMTEYIDIILRECRRCSDIVKSLLTFSPRKQAELMPVDLNQMVRNVIRILHHRLKQYPPAFLSLDLAESLPAIQGLSAELEQVALNLILNAMDATDANGCIQISTQTCPKCRWVLMRVQDDGCGIKSRHRSRLFEPFFTTKPVGQGVGIGLSTCYNIIQAHGGEILVDSVEGRGSRFTVRLPQTG